MQPIEALQASVDALQAIVGDKPIADDELHNPTPCRAFDVQQLCDHIIDTHNLLLTAAGGQAVDSESAFADRHAAVAAASLARWSERGTADPVTLFDNELPGEVGLLIHAMETYVHGWDLARSLGRVFAPPADLTEEIWQLATDLISDDVRGDAPGAPYGPAVTVGNDADTMSRLLAHTGRVVGHREGGAALVVAGRDRDAPADGGVLDGVVDQLTEDLLEADRVDSCHDRPLAT